MRRSDKFTPVYTLEEYLDPGKVWYKNIYYVGEKFFFRYPDIKCNKHFKYQLVDTVFFKGLFTPLEFLNILYEQLEVLLELFESSNNKENIDECEEAIFEYFKNIFVNKRKTYFFLGSLHYLICNLNSPKRAIPLNYRNKTEPTSFSLLYIAAELEEIIKESRNELIKELPGEDIPDYFPEQDIFTLSANKNKLNAAYKEGIYLRVAYKKHFGVYKSMNDEDIIVYEDLNSKDNLSKYITKVNKEYALMLNSKKGIDSNIEAIRDIISEKCLSEIGEAEAKKFLKKLEDRRNKL